MAEKLVSRYNIPAITSYIVLGIILGPDFLNLTGEGLVSASETLFNIALGFIAFHLGRNFVVESYQTIGKAVIYISLTAAIVPVDYCDRRNILFDEAAFPRRSYIRCNIGGNGACCDHDGSETVQSERGFY